jgi:hypothetical protein
MRKILRYRQQIFPLSKVFAGVKKIFDLFTHYQIFDLPKLRRLGQFSLTI